MENTDKICLCRTFFVPLHPILKVTGIGNRKADHKMRYFQYIQLSSIRCNRFYSMTLTLEKSMWFYDSKGVRNGTNTPTPAESARKITKNIGLIQITHTRNAHNPNKCKTNIKNRQSWDEGKQITTAYWFRSF